MIKIPVPKKFEFPCMRQIHQKFYIPPKIDIAKVINREWCGIKGSLPIKAGDRIAVGVGSRGLSNLVQIVRDIVEKLKSIGAKPFITPAMGSHGGSTVKGQIEMLAHLGITEVSIGAPVEAEMDVVFIGEAGGIQLNIGRLAHEADGIVLINRVKPHTDFTGPIESGIIKMSVIGLGNQIGADYYHRMMLTRGHYNTISTAGRAILQKSKFLFGVALVENQNHDICELRMVPSKKMESIEKELLKKARSYLSILPIDEIDLLIVDEMGKDISGTGLDTNVIGSMPHWKNTNSQTIPQISRIFVRDLTAASEGNATGMSMVHVTTKRFTDKVDLQSTAINVIAANDIGDFKIPMTLPTERDAVAVALMTIRPYTISDLRIVHIKNTLSLNQMLVSEGCLSVLENNPDIQIGLTDIPLEFDDKGNLL